MQDLYLLIIALIIPALAQGYVSIAYGKYRKEQNGNQITGYDVARKILDANGLNNLYIVRTGGKLSDHYDPTRKTIRLSEEIYNGSSIAAAAIAAHECGHAVQDKEGYFFMKIRAAIFPVVSLGTKFAYFVLLAGIIFEMMNLIWVAIVLVGLEIGRAHV